MSVATIFALATPPGRSGVAVIRISGPGSLDCLRSFGATIPEPRFVSVRTLREADGAAIDQAVVLYFQAPASFTGEDVVELQCHGSRAVVSSLLDHLGALSFARPATPGEFARQAFGNGRLDLPQVEALQDLIEAETRAQRRQALFGMAGSGLGAIAAAWREQLVLALALCEAAIDFSDEPDIESDTVRRSLQLAGQLHAGIVEALRSAENGERVRSGTTVVIAGPPNAGKSTLLNRLARREAAIVSEYAGTTRDAIEVHLDIAGQAVALVDTAGIHDAVDPVEVEGIRRSRARIDTADLVLWLVPPGGSDRHNGGREVWTVGTKADIAKAAGCEFWLSAQDGTGFDELIARLEAFVSRSRSTSLNLVTRERHRALLLSAAARLRSAVDSGPDRVEKIAEDLRAAAVALDELLGAISNEDVLDRVFSTFCIGK